ncbi:MAG: hypothetical protein IKH51_06285, partial [Clostridia bacterium]|nr:hypothetical protein [Clostridia bacterium]
NFYRASSGIAGGGIGSSPNAVNKVVTPEPPIKKVSKTETSEKLNKLDIRVLRYSNKAVNMIFNKVCEDILMKLGLTVKDLKPLKKRR